MNAITLTTNPENDYRAAMQQAAVAYLYRHRSEHLSGDSQPLENCTRYLVQSLEVPAQIVQRIAELAVAEFESMTCNRISWLGFDPSRGPYRARIMLLDTCTQQRRPVSARILPKHLLHPQ